MKQAMSLTVCSAVLALAAGSAQAQVHKCVDASGKTVYSQSPCPKGAAKSSTLERTAPPAPAAAAKGDKGSGPKTAAELDQEFRKRQKEQGEAQKKQEETLAQAREKEENCKRSRAHLASLDSGRQMRMDDKGERVFMEDAEVDREKERARKSVQTFCG